MERNVQIDQQTIRPGDTGKPDPYTIVFVANPALERPWKSGAYVDDPICGNKADFDAAVNHAVDCLFAKLTGQVETLLADPAIDPHVRVISLRVTGLLPNSATALVGESPLGRMLVPRRDELRSFVSSVVPVVDVIIAVADSTVYTRESAWATTDDVTRAGTPFMLDGAAATHWHYPQIPGTAALHKTTRSITPLHEFGHAASSYNSGFVQDLYDDVKKPQLNCLIGRPIPTAFRDYNGVSLPSDQTRGILGYPASWKSYHCDRATPAPSLMDDYTKAANAFDCRFDQISAVYLRDRLTAKIGR
jgi:hypothetical protein